MKGTFSNSKSNHRLSGDVPQVKPIPPLRSGTLPADALDLIASERKSIRACSALVWSAFSRAVLRDTERRAMDWILRCTVSRGRWHVRVPSLAEFGEQCGLAESVLSEALNGRAADGYEGLIALGLIYKKVLPRAERGCVLLLCPDWRQWKCGFVCGELVLQSWLSMADVCSELSQDEFAAVEDCFPSLAATWARVSAENVMKRRASSNAGRISAADAPSEARGEAGRISASLASGDIADAPNGRGSEIPKAIYAGNGRRFGNSEGSRARALSSVTGSSISALTLSIEELKNLIRSGKEQDFVVAMQAIIPTHENGDGGKWRSNWRKPELRGHVVRVFEALIEKIATGTLQRGPGLEAHYFWTDYGGAAAKKKLEDSYTN